MRTCESVSIAQAAKWGYEISDAGRFNKQLQEAWDKYVQFSEELSDDCGPSSSPLIDPDTIAGMQTSDIESSPTPQPWTSASMMPKGKGVAKQPRRSARHRNRNPIKKIRDAFDAENPTPAQEVIRATFDQSELPQKGYPRFAARKPALLESALKKLPRDAK